MLANLAPKRGVVREQARSYKKAIRSDKLSRWTKGTAPAVPFLLGFAKIPALFCRMPL
ncbi:hypothetical protein [Pseudomonas sp.]|uniref:hypothetical protein n=1 Tax=Pseudomonas sp. TaxID=306 RepID=UPI0029090E9C|nr:hypothetical protein [Pseudomonas sp.]MDU4249630.1 hypothetical protein [Pseudomonas sp.]